MGDPFTTTAGVVAVDKLLKGPKIPKVKTPADRPEREVDVKPEDIELGGVEELGDATKPKGKRSLLRPAGGTPTSGLNI